MWYHKLTGMCTNDDRFPFKLFANEWNGMKSKVCPIKCWLAQSNPVKKKIIVQEKILKIKLIKKPLIKEGVKNLRWLFTPQLIIERTYTCEPGVRVTVMEFTLFTRSGVRSRDLH